MIRPAQRSLRTERHESSEDRQSLSSCTELISLPKLFKPTRSEKLNSLGRLPSESLSIATLLLHMLTFKTGETYACFVKTLCKLCAWANSTSVCSCSAVVWLLSDKLSWVGLGLGRLNSTNVPPFYRANRAHRAGTLPDQHLAKSKMGLGAVEDHSY